jgi:hypothetical protein
MAVTKKTDSKKSLIAETPDGKKLVQLANGVQTYVTPSGEVYVASKVYAVTPAKQEELFAYTEAIQGMPIFKTAVIQKRKVTEESFIAEAGKVGDDKEMDTGSMQLRDADGQDVGVVSV